MWSILKWSCFDSLKRNSFSAHLLCFHCECLYSKMIYWYTLCWIFFIVLFHWNNSTQIDMLPHSDTLFWYRANQSLLFLLNAAEKQLIPISESLIVKPIFHCECLYTKMIYWYKLQNLLNFTSCRYLLVFLSILSSVNSPLSP
jgi:hypothetical protein